MTSGILLFYMLCLCYTWPGIPHAGNLVTLVVMEQFGAIDLHRKFPTWLSQWFDGDVFEILIINMVKISPYFLKPTNYGNLTNLISPYLFLKPTMAIHTKQMQIESIWIPMVPNHFIRNVAAHVAQGDSQYVCSKPPEPSKKPILNFVSVARRHPTSRAFLCRRNAWEHSVFFVWAFISKHIQYD